MERETSAKESVIAVLPRALRTTNNQLTIDLFGIH